MSQLQMLYGQVLANIIAVVIVVLCWRWKAVGRLSLVLLFVWAAQYNFRAAFDRPEQYLVYARLAYSTWYQQFILTFFAQHTTAVVASIGVGQFAAAVLMSLSGLAVYFGLAGAVISLVGIAPLGSGSAFPSTVIAAWGAILLFRHTYSATLPGELSHVLSHDQQPTGEPAAGAKRIELKGNRTIVPHDPDAHLGHRGAE